MVESNVANWVRIPELVLALPEPHDALRGGGAIPAEKATFEALHTRSRTACNTYGYGASEYVQAALEFRRRLDTFFADSLSDPSAPLPY